MLRSRKGWLFAFLCSCAVWLVAMAPAASAHAVFVSAAPAPNASLQAPPASIRIVFSEPLVAALSGIRLVAPSGATVAERHPGVDPADHNAYVAGLPRLRPGHYTVVWHTTSAVDGHSRWGSYGFTVLLPGGRQPPGARRPAGLAGPAAWPTPVPAAAAWLGLAGLFLITGAVLMLLLQGPPGERAGRQALDWLLVAGAAACTAGVAGQAAVSWAAAGWASSAAAVLLTQGVAHWWWLRLAAAAAALLACHRRAHLGTGRRVAAGAAVAALAVGFAGSSHAAAAVSPAVGLAFMAVHVLAGSVWLGGVLALAVLWALAARNRAPGGELRTLVRRFSVVAGMAVPAVAATGLASALLELGGPADLVTSGYGRALLVKMGVAGLAGTAALASMYIHRAAGAPRWSARARAVLLLEAGLGLAILVPTAVMSVLAPPGPAAALRSAARQIAARSDPAASFTGYTQFRGRGTELSLTPGEAGTNAVRAEVDGLFGAPRLAIQLSAPGQPAVTVSLRRSGTDHDPQTHTLYTGAVGLARAGDWQAVLRGPGGATEPVVIPVRAAAPGAAAAGLGQRAGWLLVIALSGASVTVLAGLRGLRRHRWHGLPLALGPIALGGAGCVAAVVWSGVLAIAPSAAARAGPAAWGDAQPVTPVTAASVSVWPVGGGDAGLMMPAVAPDGLVWVGEMSANKLAALSPAGRVVRQVALPGGYKEVMGLAVDQAGHVWIAEEHAQSLGMFDAATGRYHQYRIPGADPAPVGVAVDRSGSVWFTEMNGDRVGRFDPGTGRFAQYRIPTPGAMPYWLAIAPDGGVWFTEFDAGRVGVLRPASGQLREYRLPGRPNPTGIAISPGGTPWLATTAGWLVRISPASGVMHRVRAPAASLYGVAVTGDGTVWLGTASGHAIYAFEPGPGRFRRYPLPAGQAPWWVAAAGRHRVWAALGGAAGGLAEIAG